MDSDYGACCTRSKRLPPGLVGRVRQAFRLDWQGIHGAGHWARVAFHGRRLASDLGVSSLVPRLFALLHDSQRRHEGRDRDHGPRAAQFVRQLQAEGTLDLSGTKVTDPEEVFISHELSDDLREKIQQNLSELESQVLHSYLEGKSYQEMAKELNRHVKSIDNALQRVKRKIEKTLGEKHL